MCRSLFVGVSPTDIVVREVPLSWEMLLASHTCLQLIREAAWQGRRSTELSLPLLASMLTMGKLLSFSASCCSSSIE